MDKKTIPCPQVRIRLAAGLILAIIVLVGIPGASAEDTMAAGIQAGAVHACPVPCSCMPASQAERLGYTLCSGNQSPCFHDSRGQPLYCYQPSSAACLPGSGCSEPAGALVRDPGVSGSPGEGTAGVPAITPASTCSPDGSGDCTVPVSTPPGPGPETADIFGMITGFFRSLFGMT